MATFKSVAYLAPRYAHYVQTAAAGTCPDAYIFVADDYYQVVEVRYRHSVAGGSNAAADVKKVASGTALASGTSVLASACDLTATADTNYTKTLSTTAAALQLAPGDALAVDTSGTLTNLAGVCVQVVLKPTRVSALVR